jgi:hypothetical protein
MARILAAVLALSLATVSFAADERTGDVTGADPKSDAQASGALHGSPTKRPPSKQKYKKPAVEEEQYRAIRTGKAAFMSAVGSCTKPEMCDPKSPARDPELVKLLQNTERTFVDACEACAPVDVCEAERVKIREGTASFRTNPCFQAKQVAKKDGSKAAPAKSTAKPEA